MTFDKYEKWGDYHWRQFALPTTYRQHALHVREWITVKNGLDVGCGDGLITYLLGPGWAGIDADPIAIRLAQAHGITASNTDVYYLSGKWEAVYLGDVLEHLEDPVKALQQIASVTNQLYLATPPRSGRLRPNHICEWTEEELTNLMNAQGWRLAEPVITENHRMYGQFIR